MSDERHGNEPREFRTIGRFVRSESSLCLPRAVSNDPRPRFSPS